MCVVTPGRIMTYLRCSHVSDDAWCMLHVAGITSSITQMRKLRPVEVKYLVLGPTARYGRDWGWGCVSPSSSSSGYAECVKWPPHLWLWVCRERGPLRGCCLFLQHPTSPHTPTRLSLSSGPFLSLQRESFHLRAVSMEEKGGGGGQQWATVLPHPGSVKARLVLRASKVRARENSPLGLLDGPAPAREVGAISKGGRLWASGGSRWAQEPHQAIQLQLLQVYSLSFQR